MHVGKLPEWFSRPVNIFSTEWNESSSIATTVLSPWHLYFSNSIIAQKLKGFSRLRADLHIKVIVNGSPFRFGEAMLSYRPLYSSYHQTTTCVAPFFSGGNIQGDYVVGYPNQDTMIMSSDRTTIMARSQRMNIRIQPHVNSGGEMVLPFIYYKDAITISDNPEVSSTAFHQALREMGTLTLESLTQLRSTAGAQAQGVSIQIYAWASNVKVWGPTAITLQGVDEYQSTMQPSEAASTVAEAAGELAKIPIISRYALATQFLANSTAGVLKYFGWSNPPVLHAVEGKLPKASFMNPNPNLSFPDDVLALDPKNELTVDPRTVGASPEDPLIVDRFCARSAIVAIQDWQVAANYSEMIAAFPVMPTYFIASRNTRTAPAVTSTRLTMIPAAYASSLFEHWRGTFVLHVKAVTSQFHRGRLLIQWDPLDTTTTGIFKETSCISHILDLSTATEATIKVPYMSSYGMQKVSQKPFSLSTAAGANFECCTRGSTTHSWTKAELERYANGIVYVRVMNQLQCGDATADVPLIFSVHFEDMQLMGPNVAPVAANIAIPLAPSASVYTAALTDFTAQGLEAPGVSEDTEIIPGGTSECVARLYGGEVIRTLRVLFHRTYPYRFKTQITNAVAVGTVVVLNGPRFPIGNHIKGGGFMDRVLQADASDNTNIVFNTPICLLSACFVGHRGSMVWKCHAFGSLDAFCMTKSTSQVPSITRSSLNNDTGVNANTDIARHMSFVQGMCPSGAAWTSNQLAGTVSGVFPPYSNLRMMPGNPVTLYYNRGTDFDIDSASTKLVEEDGIRVIGYKAEPQYTAGSVAVSNPDITLALSVAAGSDFNVFEFVNVPDLFIRGT